ncbi:MAG: DUF1127 domain-containing protein [Alphaproteobacteria bacterium]|nr:DUF1127 domain-containing protein [Alphaproteobacteria bacterium]
MHTISSQSPRQREIGLWRRFYEIFACWRRRNRQRFDLSKLDDRMLRDIGISWEEADNESSKPFWRS